MSDTGELQLVDWKLGMVISSSSTPTGVPLASSSTDQISLEEAFVPESMCSFHMEK